MPYLMALKALPWRFIGWVALAFAFAALLAGLRLEQAHSAKLTAQLHASESARQADRKSYETAQAQAALTNQKQVAEENKLRAQISDASRSSYLADRDRLRSQSRAPQSPAKPTSASGLPQASPGVASEELPLPSQDLLLAQELELQLNALIDWVNQQGAVKHVVPAQPQ